MSGSIVLQEHSLREHHIFFWIIMTAYIWIKNKDLHCQDK